MKEYKMKYYSDENYINIPLPEEYEQNYRLCPESISYDGIAFSFDIDCFKLKRIEFIRNRRDYAKKDLDGFYWGRFLDNDTPMITDCESLRQSLLNAPENAIIALESATTEEEVMAVTLQSVIVVPESLKDIVNRWLNEE